MILNEIVKNFFKQPDISSDDKSSKVTSDNIISDLSNSDLYQSTGVFFDDSYSNGIFGNTDNVNILFQQKEKILKYRQVSSTPDVVDAIDEIVNEIIFSYDDQIPLKIDINEENDRLVEAITEKFQKIIRLMNIKRNLFQIVRRGYIDGQIIAHCSYDKNTTKNGIQSIKLIEPCMFYFDQKESKFKYMVDDRNFGFKQIDGFEYSIEEIVREDFGLYENKMNLGYLEYAIKPANILKTLEDLLIPMRFSRSISRRVFNVDIGDLPGKRGAEVMKDHQNKFKYKKFYNNETGEVSNQQHITSMVEDYWFANRSGGKGTTVDVLDESGNLGELGDILYFSKKLYRALKIPNSRISTDPEADHEFDYESTRVSKDDMKFFMFISRLRQVFSSFFKEILKREVISSGIMKESEWDMKEDMINISFIKENQFIEKMKIANLNEQLEIYAVAKEYAGTLFSYEDCMKTIFKYSDDEISEKIKNINREKKDPKYKFFYSEEI